MVALLPACTVFFMDYTDSNFATYLEPCDFFCPFLLELIMLYYTIKKQVW